MKFTELGGHIHKARQNGDQEPFFPMYVIAGEDAYLKQRAAAMFRELVNPDYSEFNLSIVSIEDGIFAVIDALNTYSFFDDFKVVLVPDIADKLTDTERTLLSAYLANPAAGTVLVAVCSAEAGKDFAAKKNIGFVDCSRLDDVAIAALADELLSEPPRCTIDRDALRELILRTLGSMSRIACELQKLKAYANGNITRADVAELTTPELDFQIFELSDAVSSKDGARSITVLDNFFKQGIKAMTVLNLLYGHYRKMLHAELHKNEPDDEVARLLGIKSGALYHVKRVSRNYSQVRLKKCVDVLHELQYGVLSGKRLETSALHEAVLTLLNT